MKTSVQAIQGVGRNSTAHRRSPQSLARVLRALQSEREQGEEQEGEADHEAEGPEHRRDRRNGVRRLVDFG